MKFAYWNGNILNGTKEMEVQTGLAILTDGEKIVDLVPNTGRVHAGGFGGKVHSSGLDEHARTSCRKRKTPEKTERQ